MLQFGDYIEFLINGIPHNVYVLALVVFCIGSALLLLTRGWNKSLRYCMGLLLSEYVILIYCSTVFFRASMAERQYDFTPFWSYSVERLIPENIMNVVVFVPIGLLIGTQIVNVPQKSLKTQKSLKITQISQITQINNVTQKSRKSQKESLPCREVIIVTQISRISQICPLTSKGMARMIISPAEIAETAEIYNTT